MKMTKELFLKLYHDAQDQPNPELYIGEYGYPDYFDEISSDPDEIIAKLTEIHRLAYMSMAEVIDASGLGKSKFARYFDIPLHTIQNWAYGARPCPEYIKLMTAELTGVIKIK